MRTDRATLPQTGQSPVAVPNHIGLVAGSGASLQHAIDKGCWAATAAACLTASANVVRNHGRSNGNSSEARRSPSISTYLPHTASFNPPTAFCTLPAAFGLSRPAECYKRRFFLGATHHYRQELRAPSIYPGALGTLVFWSNRPTSLLSRHIRLLSQDIA
jgi:hypothetical protein